LAQFLTVLSTLAPAELLILQSTAFCNIDCSYCYLPNRSARLRMSHDTLDAARQFCLDNGLVGPDTTVVWHAGEPLTVPVSWYRTASSVLGRGWPSFALRQSFQTNATLINDEWCAYFREWEASVGVSIDGPAWLHDARRKTRSGAGTHQSTMRGISVLRRAGIEPHVICVVSERSLDAADAIMDFFIGEGLSRLGFNIEEIEGANRSSSFCTLALETRFARFFARVLERAEDSPIEIVVREDVLVRNMLRSPRFGEGSTGSEASPFAIVSISAEGKISTFSPELIGQDARSGDPSGYLLGDVRTDTLANVMSRPSYRSLANEIARGVENCRVGCQYFDLCGGGAPANKLAERGRFDVTETQFCRLTRQIVADVVLARIENKLNSSR
jgi:uncharacterized protein